ncbi:MAG: MFS transporter [Clostridia bacterium]|nr:MFS transporter [Clostridia bacterium]
MSIRSDFRHTLLASYMGYIVQAVVNNFVPLLFVTFQTDYHISLNQLSLLVFINFGVQLVVDIFAARFVDRIGYRFSVVTAHVFSAAGLLLLAILPNICAIPYVGVLIAVIVYAIGGGLLEVLISPIVEAAPTENKSAHMSLLHSFYCWGHMGVVLLSTLFFLFAGVDHWSTLAVLWALLPIANGIYFCFVPIRTLQESTHESMPLRKLFRLSDFWVLILLMLCAGAAEQAMSQWASAFAEAGLSVSKTVGDLAGPCLFAAMMGLSRLVYSLFSKRINLRAFMLFSCGLSISGYLLASLCKIPIIALCGCALCGFACGIMWPGTYSIAADRCPGGGTALFALLALAGDLGCSSGPALVGFATGATDGRLQSGMLIALLFPLVMGIVLLLHKRRKKSTRLKMQET